MIMEILTGVGGGGGGGGILSYLQEILGDSVLFNKKKVGGFCPGGDFVLHSSNLPKYYFIELFFFIYNLLFF